MEKNAKAQEKKQEEDIPVCPYEKKCGGCAYLDIGYESQLLKKQRLTDKILKKYGETEPIIGMNYPYHYRNKVHAVFGEKKRGQTICGTYQEGTHRVVDIEECMIQDQISTEIIRSIKELLASFKIRPFNEDTGCGLLRHVLVRRGFATGEIMVVLVLASPIFPSSSNFVKALLKRYPKITTIVLNINDRRTSMVLGEREKVLYGKGYIADELLGCRFYLSPKSFYQVNPVQTKHLYRTALSFAKLTGKERILDAYCGIGTIGLIAAREAGQVTTVELNRDAVRDAVRNAKLNRISNVRFICDDAGKFMMKAAEKREHYDVVFMDPPRSGSSGEFLAAVKKLAPKRVVYISCNPQTLARDLEILGEKYRVERIQPVDMFPFTVHIECIVLLKRK